MNMNIKGNENGSGKKHGRNFKNLFGMNFKRFLFLIGQTVMVFAVIMLFNFAGGFLKKKVDFKLDLWPGKVNSLSPGFRTYLKNYDRKIKFLLCEPTYEYSGGSMDMSAFDEIRSGIFAANPDFDVEVVSSQKKLAEKLKGVEMLEFMRTEPDYSYYENAFQARGIYIIDETDPDRRRGLFLNGRYLNRNVNQVSFDEFDSMDKMEGRKVYVDAYAFERGFAGALEKLADSSLIRVAATTGHGEYDLSMASAFFSSIGVKVEKFNLTKGELSPEKQLLLIVAPRTDFSAEELDKLNAFLNAGGKLVYCASAAQKKLEKLEEFLKVRGIEFSEGCVVNVGKEKPDVLIGIDLKEQNNAYTEKMVERNWPLVFGGCRPMKLQATQDGWQAFEICKTPNSCAVVTKDSAKNIEEIKNSPKSEYLVAGGVQKELEAGKVSKIVVVSCANLLNGVFTSDFAGSGGRFEQEGSNMHFYLTSNSNFIYSLFKETSGQNVFDYFPVKTSTMSGSVSYVINSEGNRNSKEQINFLRKLNVSITVSIVGVFLLMWVVATILRRRKR